MMHGKVYVAVWCATEHASGHILLPSTVVDPDTANGPLTVMNVHHNQSGAGPCGYDPSHWKYTLLSYRAHSSHLHDAIATLAKRLLNSIIP